MLLSVSLVCIFATMLILNFKFKSLLIKREHFTLYLQCTDLRFGLFLAPQGPMACIRLRQQAATAFSSRSRLFHHKVKLSRFYISVIVVLICSTNHSALQLSQEGYLDQILTICFKVSTKSVLYNVKRI